MTFYDWTGKLTDAPYEVVDAAVQKVLNGAPTPYISPFDAMPQFFIERSPEYTKEYFGLCELYIAEFKDSDQLDLNEYGFSTWESSHPVINDLRLVYNKFHWYHMRPIVQRIERSIRIQELESGKRYSDKDRLELIAAKAYEEREQVRLKDIAEQSDAWRADLAREERARDREFIETLSQPRQSSDSLVDKAIRFNNSNPLTTGVVGASIFHALKDAFGIK